MIPRKYVFVVGLRETRMLIRALQGNRGMKTLVICTMGYEMYVYE